MAIQFSYYEHYSRTQPSASIEFENFLNDIKTGRWEDLTHAVRTQRISKTSLPLVTMSGTFDQRSLKGLITHSGLLCIDVDDCDPEQVKNLLSRDEYVSAIFTSVSGQGAAVVIAVDPDQHLESFLYLEKYFFETYKIIIDRSCKDVSRARFVSFDPNLYYNPRAKICKKKLPADKIKSPKIVFVQSDFDAVISKVQSQNINLCESYHEWLRVGFAFAAHLGEAGRQYFHAVSAASGKYTVQQCDAQFTNCLRAKGHGITMGTFYWMLKQAGIEPYSEKTKQIASAASGLKSSGKTPELVMKNLEKFGGFDPIDSSSIVQQVMQNDAMVDAPNIIEQVRAYLHTSYNIRQNEISRHVEIDGANVTDKMLNSLFLECKARFKLATFELVCQIIYSKFTPVYNPIHEFFESNKHINGQGAICALLSSISTSTGFTDSFRPDYLEHFGTRWIVGLVAAAY